MSRRAESIAKPYRSTTFKYEVPVFLREDQYL